MHRIPALACVLSLVAMAAVPGRAGAETHVPALENTWILAAGALDNTGQFRVAKGFRGEEIDIIDLDRLGVDDHDLNVFASVEWRATDRWMLGLDVFHLEVAGGRRVDFEFDYGDVSVPVGARVDSELDLAFYVFSAGYSVYRSDRADVQVGLGVHAVDTRYSLEARLQVGDNEQSLGSESDDFLAPLPNVYARARYAFGRQLVGHVKSGWLSLTYDDVSGDLLSLHAELDWWFSDRFAVSLGYSFLDLDIEDRGKVFKEIYDLEMHGPRLTFKLGL